MSYKDARRPAPDPKPAPTETPKPETAQTPPEQPEPSAAEKQRQREDEAMAEIYAAQAHRMKHALRTLPWRADASSGISPEAMSQLLQDVAGCMHSIVSAVTNVLTTVELGDMRKIFVPEAGFSPGLAKDLEAMGVDTKAYTPKPEAKTEGDHRKGPRGATHPLLSLLRLAVQASKVLKQIAAGTYPEIMNVETPEDKLEIAKARADAVIWQE